MFGMGTGVAPPALPPGIRAGEFAPPAPNTKHLECSQTNIPHPAHEPRSVPRSSSSNRWLIYDAIVVKPLGRLVPVSSTPHGASTSGLSTWSSPRGLQGASAPGGLIFRRVSRLDAFSASPCRT